MVGLVSTEGPSLDSFDSDIIGKEEIFVKMPPLVVNLAAMVLNLQTFNKLNCRATRIRSQYRLLP
jgi:hypothetical protein